MIHFAISFLAPGVLSSARSLVLSIDPHSLYLYASDDGKRFVCCYMLPTNQELIETKSG